MTAPISDLNTLATTLDVQREQWDEKNIPPPNTEIAQGELLRMIAKGPSTNEGVIVTGNIKGDGKIKIPLWTGSGGNAASNFGKAASTHVAQDFEQFVAPMQELWNFFSIEWKAMQFAANGGFVMPIPMMLTGTRTAFWRSLSWMIHEDGSGSIAKTQTTPEVGTGITTSTLVLQQKDLIHRIRKGDKLSLAAGPRVGGTLVTRRVGVTPGEGGILVVTGIDENRGRLTFPAAVDTIVPTAANGDYLTLDGFYDGTSLSSPGTSGPIAGLDLWCPARTSDVNTLYGVPRGENPSRLAGRRVNVPIAGFHEAIGNLSVELAFLPHAAGENELSGALFFPARMNKRLMDAFASQNITVTNAMTGATTGSDPLKMQFGISGAVAIFPSGHKLVLKSDAMMGDMELTREADATMRVVLNGNLEVVTTIAGVNWQMRDGSRILIPVDGNTTQHNAPYGAILQFITHNTAKNLVVSTETEK